MRPGRYRRILLVFAFLPAATAVVGVAPLTPPAREITLKELLPLANSQKEFKIIDGKDRGKMVPLIFQADSTDDQRWKLIFGDYGRIFLKSGPGGVLLMERLDLIRSKSYVVYDPPLLVLPADIQSAGFVQRQTGYRMYNAETGKLKRSGRVTHLVKRISHSQFDTPAGVLDGYHIEIEHRMDMEYYSQLLLTVGLGCRPEEGLVYGSAQYKLKKLGGLLTETKTAVAALARK
jgi:hypothetical protein